MKKIKPLFVVINMLIIAVIISPVVLTEEIKSNVVQNHSKQINEEPKQQHEELVTLIGGRFRGFNVEYTGAVKAPFYCLRIPGLFYFIHSANGGEITIYDIDGGYEIPLSGDESFRMTIALGACVFVPPVHNFENLLPRTFGGKAFAIDVTLV